MLLTILPARAGWAPFMAGSSPAFSGWETLRIGGGGQLEGISIANDGTKVVKADVWAGYVSDDTNTVWRILATPTNISQFPSGFNNSGFWEVCIAPSNSSRIYIMVWGQALVSNDQGLNWTTTGMPAYTGFNGGNTDANGTNKFYDQKCAVDPNNPDVAYFATNNNGIQFTDNGGTTTSQVTSITASTAGPGGSGIAFDASSGTIMVGSQKRTAVVYASSYGQGTWRSADGGQTWTQIANGTGNPDEIWVAKVDAGGNYWAVDSVSTWKFVPSSFSGLGTGWTEITFNGNPLPGPQQTVIPDLSNASIVTLFNASGGGTVYRSVNGGADIIAGTCFNWQGTNGFNGFQVRAVTSTTDVTWLLSQDIGTHGAFNIGDAVLDPINGQIFIAEGVGVWTGTMPTNNSTNVVLDVQTSGIEELVANDVIAPTGASTPIVAVWDRGFFTPAVGANTAYPTANQPSNGTFVAGWSVDYASNNEAFIVGLATWSGGTVKSAFTSTGGAPWTIFPNQPTSPTGGTIAASNSSCILAVGNGVPPVYTLNEGATAWVSTTTGSNPLPNNGGYNNSLISYSKGLIAADRVTANTFYIVNYVSGVYSSSDCGQNWTLVHSGHIDVGDSASGSLRATPGVAGDVWWTPKGDGGLAPLYESIDGGATWTSIPNLTINYFGLGAIKSGASYPTIIVRGTYNSGPFSGTNGIWASTDHGVTWNLWSCYNTSTCTPNAQPYLMPSANATNSLDGDQTTYGRVYLGTFGNGFFAGQFNYLLKRDLDPAANDNTPAFLNKVG